MGKFVKGDVVVIPFPFSDLSSSKRRPAIILADWQGDDVILAQITSKLKKDPFVIMLEPSDIVEGTLSQSSYIRPNKLFTADSSMILYKIGQLRTEKLEEVIQSVIKLFRR